MQEILDQLKLKCEVVRTENNGTVSRYFLRLRPGAKVKKIENCALEIAIGTRSYGKPLIKAMPSEGLVVIELLNSKIHQVMFSEFDPWFQFLLMDEYGDLPIILGRQHDGEELVVDLATMPHLLVAGSTGSGKSVLLHSIICSLIKSGRRMRLVLIDPKRVEFEGYKDLQQLLYPIINTPEQALDVLEDLINEMNERFVLLNRVGVNNLQEYNKQENAIPFIVLVIDEFADLQRSYKKEFQDYVSTLANKSRAVGIHLILATQHPVVSVVSGVVKANFASRIALKTASAIDSRVILDCGGAERLAGHGDALINAGELEMMRFQTAFVNREEIDKICLENQRKKRFWDKLKEIL